MSRCPQCGMKECCGADMDPVIEKHASTIAELRERHAAFVRRIREHAADVFNSADEGSMPERRAIKMIAICDAELAKEQSNG